VKGDFGMETNGTNAPVKSSFQSVGIDWPVLTYWVTYLSIVFGGKVIELEPEDPELLEVGNMVYLPRLVAIDCPRCSAEVRLDRFLEDFTLREL